MLRSILVKLRLYAIGAVAIAASLFAASRIGKRSAKREQEVDQLKQRAEALKVVHNVKDKISSLSDDAVLGRAIKRMQRNKKR